MRRKTVLAIVAATLCACAPPATQAQAVEGSLFLAAPVQQWRLPAALREISGLAVAPDGRLFAHDDENAIIYEIDVAGGRIVKSFALGDPILRDDFEGLAIAPDGAFWMTTSRGELYRFEEGDEAEHVSYERFDAGLGGSCEVEGLAYLVSESSLILACKRDDSPQMQSGDVTLRAWRPGAPAAQIWRTLSGDRLAQAAGVRRFRPSSLDFDPASGRMLVLSGNDGALAEFDAAGAIVSVRALQRDHRQAEGLAVLPGGALLISDEGGDSHALLSRYDRAP